MARNYRQMVRQIKAHPDDAEARLKTLQLAVAEKFDNTTSAREIATLARVLLDIEAAFREIRAAREKAVPAPSSPVDELLARRAERGAK